MVCLDILYWYVKTSLHNNTIDCKQGVDDGLNIYVFDECVYLLYINNQYIKM